MNKLYQISGTVHNMHAGQLFLRDATYFPQFQVYLEIFKKFIKDLIDAGQGATFVHFGDGDYYFLKTLPIGSARPGNRALSLPYNQIDISIYRSGWLKADYHCVEYLEKGMREKLQELYPGQKTIPTEYIYGLTTSRWFFREFAGKLGLIGAAPKIKLIKALMQCTEYQDYLGIKEFTDYIEIPQKFACDNLESTISTVRDQLLMANPETKMYLYGVGHVKSGLIHCLPSIKKAVYMDVGAGIDAIAGILDPDRPYAAGWINYRLSQYDYSNIDLLAYDIHKDKNIKIIS